MHGRKREITKSSETGSQLFMVLVNAFRKKRNADLKMIYIHVKSATYIKGQTYFIEPVLKGPGSRSVISSIFSI